MKQKALLLAALLLAVVAPHVAWGQEFGPHLNLKGKEAFYVSSILPLFVIQLREPSDAPPGFDREAIGKELVSRLTETLRAAGVSVREVFPTVGADAALELYFNILPFMRGGIVDGYAINGELVVRAWTSHSYPVGIWEISLLTVTPSKTARELRSDLLEMTADMAARLIAAWNKANR